MKRLVRLAAFVLFIVYFGVGCEGSEMTSYRLERLINSDLIEGDSSEKIEEVLQKYNIGYSFDDFQSRYQGIIRDPSSMEPRGYHNIVVYIYVDENKYFFEQK